ncbi:taste receptor type 2 member 9-like [Bufo bufo]|uniref:taste receptor type 2 member 9-like n=1 Tax=Bufo bufo TaxID=8384 RepID=UPI001ABE0DC4|nr:taste receptor type 2 member 9-like [Bufo bufo]
MLLILSYVNLLTAWTTVIPGTSLNLFIIAVYLKFWRKPTRAGVCEKILLSTAITHVCLQVTLGLDAGLDFFEIYCIDALAYKAIFLVIVFLIDVTFWNSTWLSIYCCLRLINISHRFFFGFKAWFSSSIVRLLLGSAVIGLVNAIPFIWMFNLRGCPNGTEDSSRIMRVTYYWVLVNITFGCCLPFSLTLLCNGLSVIHLLRHVWRVKQNNSPMSSPQLSGHVQAAKTMILRVLVEFGFQVVMVFLMLSVDIYNSVQMVCWTILCYYPSAQSIAIILGNPKLRELFCGGGASSS